MKIKLLLIMLVLSVPVLAQERSTSKSGPLGAEVEARLGRSAPKPLPRTIQLSEAEQKEIKDAAGVIQQRISELNSVFQEILVAPTGKGEELRLKAQLAKERLDNANLQAQRIKDRHTDKHECAECVYSTDWKTLVEQPPSNK